MKKILFLILPIVLLVLACNSPFGNNTNRLKYTAAVGSGQNSTESSIKLFYRTLKINIDGDGYVLVNDKEYDTELKLLKDTKVRIEAIANAGQEFTGFSGSINSVNSVEEIVMDKDITITASFVVPTVYKKLFLTIRKGGAVEIDGVMQKNTTEESIDIVKEYVEGTIVNLRAIPNDPAIEFGGWSGSVETKDLSISVVLDKTITLSASFSTEKYITINNSPFSKVGIKVNNVLLGEYTESKIEVQVEVGDLVEISATSKDEYSRTYTFAGWTGTITSSSPIINTAINKDLILTLDFVQVMKTLTINTLQGKAMSYRVNGNTYTGPTAYPIDTVVNVELVEKYYPFISWGGDASGNSKTVSVELKDNKTINATFETGTFDKYDNPMLNGYNASKFDNTWLIEASFNTDEFPTYVFKTRSSGSTSIEWKTGDANYNEYTYGGADTTAAGKDVSGVIYYQYRGVNYYYKKDKPNIDYHTGWHKNRLERFHFYRFFGKALGITPIDNAMSVVDTYTKLVYAYAVPTEFKSILGIWAPDKWESIEATNGGTYKFYEYDPIGYVKEDGTVQLFESFRAIQKRGKDVYIRSLALTSADKEKQRQEKLNKTKAYFPNPPSITKAPEFDNTDKLSQLGTAGGIRSPYLE